MAWEDVGPVWNPIATAISRALTNTWYDPYAVFKYGLEEEEGVHLFQEVWTIRLDPAPSWSYLLRHLCTDSHFSLGGCNTEIRDLLCGSQLGVLPMLSQERRISVFQGSYLSRFSQNF